jgi:hypothetical protein
MARGSRLTAITRRLPVVLLAITAAHGAHGAGADVSGFVGVWTFQGASQVQAVCAALGTVVEPLSGTRISIYPGTDTDLVFDIGCSCTIGLDVSGSRATVVGTQPCLVIPRGQQLSGQIGELTADLSADGQLSVTLSGDDAVLGSGPSSCALSSLSGSGTLTRTGTGTINCGDGATAVGVIPYSPLGEVECPFGAGTEALRIRMHDEDDPACSDTAGSHGEGQWVLPDDGRRGPPICTSNHTTTLNFCRVDGARFESLSTTVIPAQAYAVLKLGTTCPNGSVDVEKTIDNEDTPVGADPSDFLGNLGPNQVLADPAVGTLTRLNFCYFRAAPTPDAVMSGFPDFGFPYGVLHRYDGEQPPWVMLKRWIYSDDEDNQAGIDAYDSVDPATAVEFQDLVGNPQSNTMFNLARVR